MLKSVKDLLLNIPLYVPQKVQHDDHARLFRLKFFAGNFDCHCKDCGCESTFKGTSEELSVGGYKVPDFKNFKNRFLTDYDVITNELLDQIYVVEAECTNNSSHGKAAFIFKVDRYSMQKIGQYPSSSALAENLSEEDASDLPFEHPQELYNMLDQASRTIGLGSFIYLEPEFRTLIKETIVLFADFFFLSNSNDLDDWNEGEYAESSIEQKIGLLQEHLPEYSSENHAAFEILRDKIYELTKKDCLKYFPLIHGGVDMILNAKLEKEAQEEKEEGTDVNEDDEDFDLEAADETATESEEETEEADDDLDLDDFGDDDAGEDSDDAADETATESEEETEEADDDLDLDDFGDDDAGEDSDDAADETATESEEETEEADDDLDLDDFGDDDAGEDSDDAADETATESEEETEEADDDLDLDDFGDDDAGEDSDDSADETATESEEETEEADDDLDLDDFGDDDAGEDSDDAADETATESEEETEDDLDLDDFGDDDASEDSDDAADETDTEGEDSEEADDDLDLDDDDDLDLDLDF